MTDRAEFEAWAVSDESWCAGIERHGDSYKTVVTAASWVAYQAGIRSAATPAPVQPEGQEDEPVGEAELMPKTAGVFTKAMFDANEVPPGTKLYLHPYRSAGAAAPAEGAAWQPIEMAPHRGIILLGLTPNEEHEDGYVSPGYWMESDDDGPDNMGHDAGFVDVHFDFFTCARSIGNPAYQHKGLQPTHWMPLPSAPKGEEPQP